jgi:phosphoribosylformimino-5-aminoimidazole carboxamide ribotide isomerase
MKIIPVIDLLNGVVVRGVAGKRELYRPVVSALTPSKDPSVVLNVIRHQFALTSFYIADLDAIQFRQLNRCTIAELARCDVSLMVDAGVRCESDVEELVNLGVDQVIVGLETLSDEQAARQIQSAFDVKQLILSLDLKNGRPLTGNAEWQDQSPEDLATLFTEIGYQNIIVLDLAAVGMDSGTHTQKLCRSIRSRHPESAIITGGGVSCVADLQAVAATGVDGVLVASALHNGQISPEEIMTLADRSQE